MELKETLDLAAKIEKIGKIADFENITPRNIKIITDAIATVNDFNSKISKYASTIFHSVYLGTINEWRERLSEKHFVHAFGVVMDRKIKRGRQDIDSGHRYVVCYRSLHVTCYDQKSGWSMGASGPINSTYKFVNGELVVTNTWETRHARFSHVPWIKRKRIFKIDLTKMSVEVSGDHIDAQ
jgi:hypothetical protein